MRLKQLAVGKIEEAGRTLGRAGGAQVFQVGRDVRLEGFAKLRNIAEADFCFSFALRAQARP